MNKHYNRKGSQRYLPARFAPLAFIFILATQTCWGEPPTLTKSKPAYSFSKKPGIAHEKIKPKMPELSDIGMKAIIFKGPDLTDLTMPAVHFDGSNIGK